MAEFRRVDCHAMALKGNNCTRLLLGSALLMLSVVASCTTGDVFALQPAVDVGSQTAAVTPIRAAPEPVVAEPVAADSMMADSMAADPTEPEPVVVAAAPGPGLQTLVPSNPYMTTYPRFTEPAPEARAMPADEVACRRELKRLGVKFRDLAPINDGGACRIENPVEMSAIGSVRLKPAATVTCDMARTFANWTKNELIPSSRMRYFSGVKTIHQGSSYSCRNIRGSRTASEHSKGNAIDVMRIELNNEKDIKVRKPGLFAFRERGLLNNVRADACGYFSTVLGPGYDRDHKDHFHFDIKQRRNGYVACR